MIYQTKQLLKYLILTLRKIYNLFYLFLLSENKFSNSHLKIKKNILSDRQTILYLKNNPKVGIIRYGNSELGLIAGNSPRTQIYNKKLGKKLVNICHFYDSNTNKKYLLALPLDNLLSSQSNYSKRSIPNWYPGLAAKWAMRFLVKRNQIYGSPFCFRILNVIDEDMENYIQLIQSLFINRKIIYVGPLQGKNPDIPEFISPSDIIKIPERNAFDKFDLIISKIKNLCSNYENPLVVIVGGTTASAISFELNISNITCYDFGQYNRLYKRYLQSKFENQEK